MNGANPLKGQPLLALLVLLGSWAGGRAIAWQPLEQRGQGVAEVRQDAARSASDGRVPVFQNGGVAGPQTLAGEGYLPGITAGFATPLAGQAAYVAPGHVAYSGDGYVYHQTYALLGPTRLGGHGDGLPFDLAALRRQNLYAARPAPLFDLRRLAGASATPQSFHGGLLDSFANLAGTTHHYAPQESAAAAASGGAPAAPPPRARRWSADAWALLRRGDGGQLAPGVLPATYGASQAGAVLRYRVDLSSRYRPTLYMRTTSTLGAISESAAALGVSARPVPSVPVVAAIEGRMTQAGGRSIVQPVAMAVTELPPIALPLNLQAEAYAQGGYVGGKYATPFADGQLRIDHGLFRLGPVETRLGGGAWAGFQKGASRVDVGPTATLAFPLGAQRYGRLALDWRFRVAGDAAPGSGPAVTLSAGF